MSFIAEGSPIGHLSSRNIRPAPFGAFFFRKGITNSWLNAQRNEISFSFVSFYLSLFPQFSLLLLEILHEYYTVIATVLGNAMFFPDIIERPGKRLENRARKVEVHRGN